MANIITEEFINEIKKHPIIWRMSHKDYKNYEIRKKEWKKIAKIFYPEIDMKSENEKEIIGK